MLRRVALCALLGGALLAVPGSSVAATELGQVGAQPTAPTCGTDAETVFGGGVPFTVPAPGVITQLRTRFAGPAGAQVALRVVRPFESRWTAVATVGATLGGSGEATVPARVPVQPGDVLGFSKLAGEARGCALGAPGALLFRAGLFEPEAMPFTPEVLPGLVPNVAATLEHDADRDGRGDESQDRCPTDPIIFDGPCLADLRVGIDELRRGATIDLGEERGLVVTVANNAVSPAAGSLLTSTLSAHVRVSSVVASRGTCTIVPGLRCDLGTLEPGGRATVVLLLQGLRTGTASVRLTAGSETAERVPGDNEANLQIPVVRTRVVRTCVVPSVRGLSLRLARALIDARGCDVGRVTKKSRRGRQAVVVAQRPSAGARRPVGTRVSLRLAAPR